VLMQVGDILLISAVTAWSTMTLAYFISMIYRNVSIVDVFWGLGFMLIALAIQDVVDLDFSNAFPLVFGLVLIWGARLTGHIAARFKLSKEDWRYELMRRESPRSFTIKSYFTVFMPQSALMLLVAMPLVVAVLIDDIALWQLITGSVIWLIGFFFEAVGDWQLNGYIKKRRNKKSFLSKGLWQYSRHPNYFGEIVMWWGLFILVASGSYWWLALLSPVTITLLITKVSGPTMLEKRWKGNKRYATYAKHTNALVPWPKISKGR